MRIALLQDDIYVPTYAGGTKANRRLMEELAARGHTCLVLARALTRSTDGPRTRHELFAAFRQRDLSPAQTDHAASWRQQGVHVRAHWLDARRQIASWIERQLESFDPDWVLVADDKRRLLLPCALDAAPTRVVLFHQTIVWFPFGPLSWDRDVAQLRRMRRARATVVISRFAQRYVKNYGGLNAHVALPPVFGSVPPPPGPRFDRGYVMMINPCRSKGIDIFLALADAFPQVPFAGVPTWGATEEDRRFLAARPNVTLLQPADDVGELLRQARVLLVPSLWPETFGYVAPEAMLRGVPVLASRLGGLPEAVQGAGELLPVRAVTRRDEHGSRPQQPTAAWIGALARLLGDEAEYVRRSRQSRQAGLRLARRASSGRVERLLQRLCEPSAGR